MAFNYLQKDRKLYSYSSGGEKGTGSSKTTGKTQAKPKSQVKTTNIATNIGTTQNNTGGSTQLGTKREIRLTGATAATTKISLTGKIANTIPISTIKTATNTGTTKTDKNTEETNTEVTQTGTNTEETNTEATQTDANTEEANTESTQTGTNTEDTNTGTTKTNTTTGTTKSNNEPTPVKVSTTGKVKTSLTGKVAPTINVPNGGTTYQGTIAKLTPERQEELEALLKANESNTQFVEQIKQKINNLGMDKSSLKNIADIVDAKNMNSEEIISSADSILKIFSDEKYKINKCLESKTDIYPSTLKLKGYTKYELLGGHINISVL